MNLPSSRTVWEQGREPGREMVVLGLALALTAAALDVLLTHRVGVLFDLSFVVVCVALALAVRPHDFFTVGVLPPLLMLVTVVLVALWRAEAIAQRDGGLVQSVVAGLSRHSAGLVIGYLLALVVLVIRLRVEVSRSGPDRRLHA